MQTTNRTRIPLVDLKTQYHALKEKIWTSLEGVMEESGFVRGPALLAFEEAFARYNGVNHCIGVNSGTDALFLALRALHVKPGDEIITVPFTFFATAEAIVNAGCTIKFVDVDKERYTIDVSQLEKAITPRTVGIIPVHLYGMPADMDSILQFAKKHRLWVLEDACQSHGASYKGKKTGSFGEIAAFSFYPSKNLGAYGDGGAIVTNDDSFAEKLKKLRDHGQTSKYHSEFAGFNSRLDAMQAAVLLVKLAYLDEWNEKRREAAQWYNEELQGTKKIKLPKSFPDSKEVFHLYVIQTEKRDDLARYLESHGISTGIHYVVPIHQQKPFRDEQHSYPVSEELAKKVLSLPIYPELSREQARYIAEKIKTFHA